MSGRRKHRHSTPQSTAKDCPAWFSSMRKIVQAGRPSKGRRRPLFGRDFTAWSRNWALNSITSTSKRSRAVKLISLTELGKWHGQAKAMHATRPGVEENQAIREGSRGRAEDGRRADGPHPEA